MRILKVSTRILFILLILAMIAIPAQAKKSTTGYQTGFERWRAADNAFAGWTLAGTVIDSSNALAFDPATAEPGSDPYPADSYYGIDYYNGGSFKVGEATSPAMPMTWAFSEAIASWNATTPTGTWIEAQMRAGFGERWSKWYVMGIWASGSETITRHSVRLQGDTDGYVAVDTLVLSKKAVPTHYQLRFRLFSADGVAVPTITNASVTLSTTAEKPKTLTAGNPALWNTLLNVPECSQMVYPDGGEVWCSPTSTSMVLGYWDKDGRSCAVRELDVVDGVWDTIYNGAGNWPFNTAYAATQGYEAYVVRFSSMSQIEPWVKANVPVVVSYAWNKGDLTGAAVSSSNGHLSVVMGFDADGDPIVNDPAAATDADVQRTYDRTEFESLWLEHSGGTTYLIYPAGAAVPAIP